MIVLLNKSEATAAMMAGGFRQLRGIYRARQDAHGFNGDGWGVSIEGIGAELVVAKTVGVFYDLFSEALDRDTGDVAGLHVRSSTHASGHLIVYRDGPEGMYVLVVGSLPRYRIVGWIDKADACKDTWWNAEARDPSYWVPQSALSPIETLSAARGMAA